MSFPATDLASYLKQTDFNVTIRGLARGMDADEETFEFSPQKVACQEWFKLDLDVVDSFMPLGIAECQDHSHALLELNFKSSDMPEELARFVDRGEEDVPVALIWSDDAVEFADVGNERGQDGVGRESVDTEDIEEAFETLQKQDSEVLLSALLTMVSEILASEISCTGLQDACGSDRRCNEAMRLLRQFQAAPDMLNARRLQRFAGAGSANKKCLRAIVQSDGGNGFPRLSAMLALLLA